MQNVPNARRAITNANIATVYYGKRIVREYRSGERLVGNIEGDNAPPFTGFVRGFGKKKKGN